MPEKPDNNVPLPGEMVEGSIAYAVTEDSVGVFRRRIILTNRRFFAIKKDAFAISPFIFYGDALEPAAVLDSLGSPTSPGRRQQLMAEGSVLADGGGPLSVAAIFRADEQTWENERVKYVSVRNRQPSGAILRVKHSLTSTEYGVLRSAEELRSFLRKTTLGTKLADE